MFEASAHSPCSAIYLRQPLLGTVRILRSVPKMLRDYILTPASLRRGTRSMNRMNGSTQGLECLALLSCENAKNARQIAEVRRNKGFCGAYPSESWHKWRRNARPKSFSGINLMRRCRSDSWVAARCFLKFKSKTDPSSLVSNYDLRRDLRQIKFDEARRDLLSFLG